MASPTDYLASFNLMDHFLSKSSDVNRLELLMQWRSYLAPVLLLLLLMTITGIGRLPQLVRQSPGAVILAGGAWAIAVGFAAAGWRGDGFPRYYPLHWLRHVTGVCFGMARRRRVTAGLLAAIAFGLSLNFGVIGDGFHRRSPSPAFLGFV